MSAIQQICCLYANCVSNSANLSFVRKCYKGMLYENKSCLQLSKSAVFADKANLDSPKQILYPVSKFFCGRQQHDYSAGISSFTLALFYTLSMFVL
jgi:hypothetical protein